EHVNLPAADRDHIVERVPEQDREFALTARRCGEPRFAGAARRRVDAEHREAMLLQFSLYRRWRVFVGKLQLDRREAGCRRGAKPLQERALVEEITEIGCEAGHDFVPKTGDVSSAVPHQSKRIPQPPTKLMGILPTLARCCDR